MERNGKGSFVHQYYKPTEIICGFRFQLAGGII